MFPAIWLQQPLEVRQQIAKDFHLTRSGGNSVTTDNGKTRIDSDGFTVDDLRKLTLQAMQEYVGSTENNYWSLWDQTVAKARRSLETPPSEEMHAETTDELPPAVPGVELPKEKVFTKPKTKKNAPV